MLPRFYKHSLYNGCRELCLVLAALAVCVSFGVGADLQYRFDSWTTDNGLPQISVNSILQTRDGFLWFTTFGGLVRYDGLRFQVFNTGNTPGLRSGRFNQLFEDKLGRLWMTTEGQGVTLYKDGVFRSFTTENGLSRNQIDTMTEEPDGSVLFLSQGGWLKWEDPRFVPYNRTWDLPENPDDVLFRSSDGGAWIQQGTRLVKYQNGTQISELEIDFRARRAYEDSYGRLWVSSQDYSLYLFENGNIKRFSKSDGDVSGSYTLVFEDHQRRIWLALRNQTGLAVYEDGKFSWYRTDQGLVNNAVHTIFQDRENTMWIGTAGGLSRMTEQVVTPYSTDDGLAANNIYPIYEDRKGRIWIGSWFGLSVFENGKFRDVTREFGLEEAQVMSLAEDADGVLWVGTWGGALRKAHGGRVETVPAQTVGGSQIRAIYPDRAGNIWFGSLEGLIRLTGGVFTRFRAGNGLLDDAITTIFEDSKGTLWVGTNAGITKYENGIFTSFGESDGIENNIVRSFYEDIDGTLWIGMYDSGLYRLKDGKFTHYSIKDGLFDNGVFRIIEDDAENFWISCNLGIYRLKKSELNDFAEGRTSVVSSIPYNRRDGMLNSECNGGGQPAGIRTGDGKIWFPTQKGVAVITPHAVPLNKEPPPVVIESLVIDARPTVVQPIVELVPGQSNLEVHYSGLSFINPELVKFKYRLKGLDEDWIDAGTRRTAYYPHLPPGEYSFTVLAANRDGVWNRQGASMTINVLPAFWQTWWFLIASIVVFLVLVYLAYRFRIGQLHDAHAARQAFARQLIESQENERKRIAAELHDSLGQSLVLIKNWALLGSRTVGDPDASTANLDQISATASEAIQEVREIAYNLGPYQLERLGLKKTIEEMVQKLADSSSMKFDVHIGNIDNCMDRKAEISLFRILQEALSNIGKHSEATETRVNIVRRSGHVQTVIRDNGKGFDAEAQNGGFGLLGMSERVGFLGGELTIRSENGKGTDVRVILPCEDHDER